MRSQYFVLMDKRPNAAATLGAQLGEYHSIRPFGGLVVPWVPFGSSGHIMRPKVRRLPGQPRSSRVNTATWCHSSGTHLPARAGSVRGCSSVCRAPGAGCGR